MNRNDKMDMARLLYFDMHKEAVDFIKDKPMDLMAMELFIMGFDIERLDLLSPVKSLILNFDGSLLTMRSRTRLEVLKKGLSNLK